MIFQDAMSSLNPKKRIIDIISEPIINFENLSEEGILEVNIPTGTPLVYEFDDDFGVIEKHYLGDEEEIAKKTNSVLNQGSIKNKEIETV